MRVVGFCPSHLAHTNCLMNVSWTKKYKISCGEVSVKPAHSSDSTQWRIFHGVFLLLVRESAKPILSLALQAGITSTCRMGLTQNEPTQAESVLQSLIAPRHGDCIGPGAIDYGSLEDRTDYWLKPTIWSLDALIFSLHTAILRLCNFGQIS